MADTWPFIHDDVQDTRGLPRLGQARVWLYVGWQRLDEGSELSMTGRWKS